MRIDVTLRGDKAQQFRRIKEELEEQRGHSLDRPDVVGELMAEHEQAERTRL